MEFDNLNMVDPPAPMQLIDTVLAGCRIVEEIGHGGMAIVYRAHQARLERWVAIKVLRPDLLATEDWLARFRREAKAAAALRHPNILTIYDYGEERGLAYIVMEYVTGGRTLQARLTGQPWAWSDAVTPLIPLGMALAYAHSEGIVHRDVKPANILLPRDDWALLGDFGLAKLLEAQQVLTRPGTVLGTPLYASPEQILGETVDRRADVYALGLVLYEAVTGRLPFDGGTPMELFIERLNRPPTPPRQVNSDVPVQLEEILMVALSQRPDDRFRDMDEFVGALEQLCRTSRRDRETDPHSATRVINRGELALGPRLCVISNGALLILSPETVALIGRSVPDSDQTVDIDLSNHGGAQAGVSRLHARLSRQQGQWLLEDLNSTNGTSVNGQRLTPGHSVTLKDGDVIEFAGLDATFFDS